MEQHKFYQPDILSCLTEIVQKNTRAYTTDFDFDAKRLWDSAQESDMERRSFLWMCRPLGTWCVLEREVFLDDTNANCIWTHYADCPEGILAYRIVIEGIRDGKLAGRVIPIDYAKQVQRVIKSALPVAIIQYRDKDEYFCENSFHAFMNSPLWSLASWANGNRLSFVSFRTATTHRSTSLSVCSIRKHFRSFIIRRTRCIKGRCPFRSD